MKTTKFNTLFIALAILFAACNPSPKSVESPKSNTIISATKVQIALQDSMINQVFNDYEILKNTLVSSNISDVKIAATKLGETMHKIKKLEKNALLAEQIAASADLSIQRKHFTQLSDELIVLFKKSEISTGTIYVQYCPMANEGKGGYWLSSKEEILNPYYGDEMLHCGEVSETISKNMSN